MNAPEGPGSTEAPVQGAGARSRPAHGRGEGAERAGLAAGRAAKLSQTVTKEELLGVCAPKGGQSESHVAPEGKASQGGSAQDKQPRGRAWEAHGTNQAPAPAGCGLRAAGAGDGGGRRVRGEGAALEGGRRGAQDKACCGNGSGPTWEPHRKAERTGAAGRRGRAQAPGRHRRILRRRIQCPGFCLREGAPTGKTDGPQRPRVLSRKTVGRRDSCYLRGRPCRRPR